MVPELEAPKVTEIQVRIDCNGCVQKIKKALHGINGIYDIYIDIPQQKLTIIGWADPEKIIEAIKKIRKVATICSQTISTESEIIPPSGEEAEKTHPTEEPPVQENPPPDDVAPPPQQQQQQQPESSKTEEVEEIHVGAYSERVDHYSGSYSTVAGFKHELRQPIHVNHSYNTYKPTQYGVTEYVPYIRPEPSRYAFYSWPEPPQQYTQYNRPERYKRPEPPPQYYSRPESPPPQQNYSRPQNNSRSHPPLKNYTQSETPQPYTQPEPPRRTYSRTEPPPQYYSQPEQLQQNRTDPPQSYRLAEPSQQYTHYNRPQPPPPQHYIHPESAPEYTPPTYYRRFEPPEYMNDYNSNNSYSEFASPFGDEDPNGCRIV